MIIRTPPKITNTKAVIKYIMVDLWSWLKDLSVGLLKINFKDNFQSFTIENIKIPAGVEVSIYNQFKNAYPGTIPTGRMILRQRGNAVIEDGDTKWDATHVYLKNPSANDAVITVIFFR